MRTALTSTAAGIAVALIGVIALVAMFGAASTAEPAVKPETAAPSSTTTAAPATTTTRGEPLVVATPAPTPALEGLSESVASVLYASGYASNINPEELTGELPPAVLALLIDREVTLTIATEAETDEDQEVTP